ncbi:hypothetical protein RUM43_015019 [Polyplax serrata]|uniref:Uncharacterized protein n=1 Tax=Polyplax serrata TaxID=468196 RepID=A0AAN8P0R5_POLSC
MLECLFGVASKNNVEPRDCSRKEIRKRDSQHVGNAEDKKGATIVKDNKNCKIQLEISEQRDRNRYKFESQALKPRKLDDVVFQCLAYENVEQSGGREEAFFFFYNSRVWQAIAV